MDRETLRFRCPKHGPTDEAGFCAPCAAEAEALLEHVARRQAAWRMQKEARDLAAREQRRRDDQAERIKTHSEWRRQQRAHAAAPAPPAATDADSTG